MLSSLMGKNNKIVFGNRHFLKPYTELEVYLKLYRTHFIIEPLYTVQYIVTYLVALAHQTFLISFSKFSKFSKFETWTLYVMEKQQNWNLKFFKVWTWLEICKRTTHFLILRR